MITLLADTAADLPDAETGIQILFDASLKGTVILVAALLTAGALRATSATNRYLIWSFAICSLLAIPLLSGVMPKWQVPVLPQVDNHSPGASNEPGAPQKPIHIAAPSNNGAESVHLDSILPIEGGEQLTAEEYMDLLAQLAALTDLAHPEDSRTEAGTSGPPAPETESRHEADSTSATSSHGFAFPLPAWHWTTWVIVIWAAGAGILVSLLLLGLGRIASITRSALPLDDDKWTQQLGNVAREVGVDRPVVLRHCRQVRSPITWGVLRPVILLPTSCLRWSPNRRRVVLLHEMSHIRRRDWAMQILSQLICAAYWFNPLVWVAGRRLAIERERACDDEVLGHGARPSDYASHLLEIARTLASGGNLTMATLGMAHRSQLEGRLLAILDPKRSRRGFGRIATLTAIVGMGAGIMPLAAMSPWAEPATIAGPADEFVSRDGDELRIESDDNFNLNWTDEDDVRYRIRVNGEVVFSDDGIESISDDGRVRITVRDDEETRKVTVRADDDGDLVYSLTVDGEKQEMSRRDRRWVNRVVAQAVQKMREFEKEMAELEIEMEGLEEEMAEMQERLREELSDLEIPEIPEINLGELEALELEHLEGLKELGKLKDLHVEVPELHLEHLEALEKLHDLHIEIPQLHLEHLEGLEKLHDLHVQIPDLEHLKELEKLEELHIKMPDLDELHEHLADLHVEIGEIEIPEIDMAELEGLGDHIRELARKHGHGDWQGELPDAAKIREQIQKQLKQHRDQLEDLDFEWNHKHAEKGHKFDFSFGDIEFDDFDPEALQEQIERMVQQHARQFEQFEQFDHQHQQQMRKLHERLKPQIERWHKQAERFRHEMPDMEKLGEALRKELGDLEHLQIEIPDMSHLQKELAPMLKELHGKMPDMEKLHERIEKQLQPQMKKLEERLKVLEKNLEEVREQIGADIADVIADEVDRDDLSRSARRDLKDAIEELAAAFADDLGFTIDDGVVELNDSTRRIARKLRAAIDDLADDYDDETIERLEAAVESVAERLEDLEIEIDEDLAKKIENFEVEVDADFGDMDFDFDDGHDDNDDDDEDDDDGWDNDVAIAA